MPVTPADVRNRQFARTWLRPGYDEEEVDALLDEVHAELERLLTENRELRAELAECLPGGTSAAPIPGAPPQPGRMAPEPAPRAEHRPEPVRIGVPAAGEEMGTAARVLVLAQRTADQAIADARREAQDTLGRARHEADGILAKARGQAEQITSGARARAPGLERVAQQRHREALGSLPWPGPSAGLRSTGLQYLQEPVPTPSAERFLSCGRLGCHSAASKIVDNRLDRRLLHTAL